MKERLPKAEELNELADVLASTFIQRRDLYARQLDDGSYVSVKKPLKSRQLTAHLLGKLTLGTYLLDPNSNGCYLVYDADDEPDWRRLQALSRFMADEGETGYLERSRRGGHLWLFFEEPMPARDIRFFGLGLLGYFNIEDMELFPKQEALSSGPGSLIRLPFGVHRKTGRRYGFHTFENLPLAPTLREQVLMLRAPEAISKPFFARYWEYFPESTAERSVETPERPRGAVWAGDADAPLSERIKTTMPVRTFVLRYVELSPGGRGLCPFHDDHHPSFAVNDEADYWKCFAGCGSGSVIDFYMLWQERVMGRECDFKTAVGELAEMLWS
jgi:hypothetical protein